MAFIVTDRQDKEHFVEVGTMPEALAQVPYAISVRVAQQGDIERHVFGADKSQPQDTQK